MGLRIGNVGLRLASAAALGAALLSVAAKPSQAVEIDFGGITPSVFSVCSHNPGDEGWVCANSVGFTANGSTFTATGFGDAFVTATALTVKGFPPSILSPPDNSLAESGLGENATGPSAPCSDTSVSTNCEIAGTASVAVVSDHLMNDVIIGSVQTGENFNFFTGDSIADLTLFATGVGGSCTPGPVADTCEVSGFSALAVGVQSGGVGNVLLTAVSQPAPVPEPASLALIGTALAGLGLFRRRRADRR